MSISGPRPQINTSNTYRVIHFDMLLVIQLAYLVAGTYVNKLFSPIQCHTGYNPKAECYDILLSGLFIVSPKH